MFYGLELDEYQENFKKCILSDEYDIIWCNAKAGTGKTLMSVACSDILINKYNKFNKLYYITIPTNFDIVGFLPGTLDEKTAVFTQPLIDAVVKLGLQPHKVITPTDIKNKKSSSGWIEPTTHTFLRGCNLDDCIIIIEESQNATIEQLKKILTRVGKNVKVIVIGHTGQIDLKKKEDSGFDLYIRHFTDIDRSVKCELVNNYRSWIARHADDF